MDQEVIGHKEVLNFFDKVISSGNLSHAYCFVGPKMVGKKTLAESLATKLLKVTRKKLSTHPDFVFVKQEINPKTSKTKKNIDIEQIRQLRSAMGSRAFMGGHKIAIIDSAEIMNINSANALLKVLEEPRGDTVLFLITPNESSLPETIRSRCQFIYFEPVDLINIEKALEQRGLEKNLTKEIVSLSRGLPGQAIEWAEDLESFEEYKQEIKRFCSLLDKPFFEKIKKIDDIFGDKSDHIVTRDKIISILDIWQLVIRDYIYKQFGNNEVSVYNIDKNIVWKKELILTANQKILEAKNRLKQNIHPRLLIEHILLCLP